MAAGMLGPDFDRALHAGQYPIRERCKGVTHVAGMGSGCHMGFAGSLEHRTFGCCQHTAVRHQLVAAGHTDRVPGLSRVGSRWEVIEGLPFAVASCWVVRNDLADLGLVRCPDPTVGLLGADAPLRLCDYSLPPSSWLSILCEFP